MAARTTDEFVRRAKATIDPETYTVLRFEKATDLDSKLMQQGLYWFRGPDDPTLVVPLDAARKAGKIKGLAERDDGWRRITLGVEVPLDQAGFLQRFVDALSRERISILPVGGFRYDHILVHEVNLERARAAIERVRHEAEAPTASSSSRR